MKSYNRKGPFRNNKRKFGNSRRNGFKWRGIRNQRRSLKQSTKRHKQKLNRCLSTPPKYINYVFFTETEVVLRILRSQTFQERKYMILRGVRPRKKIFYIVNQVDRFKRFSSGTFTRCPTVEGWSTRRLKAQISYFQIIDMISHLKSI